MTITDANDFLMGGGVTSAKFPAIGTTITGTICRPPEVQQQTDAKTGDLKFWSDGKPMQQLQVQLATNERDPQTDHDDGVRAIYVKGKMQAAVRDAVRRSGAKGLEIGGTLTVTYTGDGEQPTNRALSAPKLYSAVYIPAPAVAASQFLEQGEPGQSAPAAPAQPAPQDPWNSQGPAPAWAQPAPPAPAPAPAYVPPAPAPAPAAPAGVTNEALAAARLLSPEQRAVLFTPEQLAALGL